MKDEIKEILEGIEVVIKHDGTLEFNAKELKILLDYITNLQEEIEHLDKVNCHLRKKINSDIYKSRNEKAIENIDLVIELIKQQPTEDDTWILNKLNGFKYLLNGGDDNE